MTWFSTADVFSSDLGKLYKNSKSRNYSASAIHIIENLQIGVDPRHAHTPLDLSACRLKTSMLLHFDRFWDDAASRSTHIHPFILEILIRRERNKIQYQLAVNDAIR